MIPQIVTESSARTEEEELDPYAAITLTDKGEDLSGFGIARSALRVPHRLVQPSARNET